MVCEHPRLNSNEGTFCKKGIVHYTLWLFEYLIVHYWCSSWHGCVGYTWGFNHSIALLHGTILSHIHGELPLEVAGSSYAAKPSRLSRKPSAWYHNGWTSETKTWWRCGNWWHFGVSKQRSLAGRPSAFEGSFLMSHRFILWLVVLGLKRC